MVQKAAWSAGTANGELVFISGFKDNEALSAEIKELFTERLARYGGMNEGFVLDRMYDTNDNFIGVKKIMRENELEGEFREVEDKSTIGILNRWADTIVKTAGMQEIDGENRIVVEGPTVLVMETNADRTAAYTAWLYKGLHFLDLCHHDRCFHTGKNQNGHKQAVPTRDGYEYLNYRARLYSASYQGDPITKFANDILKAVKSIEKDGYTWDNSMDQLANFKIEFPDLLK